MSFILPSLPYAYDALAPYMSAETLQYHHDKHHQAYVTAGNNLLQATPLAEKSLEEIVRESYGTHPALFNNAGQHYNHVHFWNWLKPNGGGAIPGRLEKAIVESFGSIKDMKGAFTQAGLTQFGSGWCWLVKEPHGKLAITKTPNGENPLVHGSQPILGCDVWEHAYYIDYRNRRADYLEAFLEYLVNWEYVEKLFLEGESNSSLG